MYEVLLERTAQRDLRRLSSDSYRRVIPHLQALAQNPRPPGSRKIAGSLNDWRIRVGEYRVVYEVDDGDRPVRVMRVRYRRDVYC